ncbi:hypothetical protein Snoj_44210 [Streptomyces nojiriensis]|uniref:Uncharacterized protein n=1 Tax=Streptomyces nojiriensis TaxID=66374 RepID=A0ABQ3SQS9_9ACTN|nr:hypothetical protein [Streptomyces nojiriensis]QTI44053.1 hypothetical protein JYK04_01816 [Streptomyces nojiriensis]QTI44063.1 hypothetical protein JYK04_01826 [Streptomyces nojiriensis]GGR85785.1 hypothetical protein GCM10010205_12870 [Streptomyces nojiriensis]GHI70503.1 hypothetical protein Snoj_44210 [Streptomyces nojiriensis]
MTTRTQPGFTPVDEDLYTQAFQLLDPTPEPTIPAVPAPVSVTRAAAPLVHRPGPVEKTLTDALAFLDTHGWAKHRLIHPEGARCSIGALRAAAGTRNAAYRDAGNLLLAEACRQHGKQWEAIPAWNDNHAGAQVRGVWEAAIQRAHHMNI